jgi:hypothetical protein
VSRREFVQASRRGWRLLWIAVDTFTATLFRRA